MLFIIKWKSDLAVQRVSKLNAMFAWRNLSLCTEHENKLYGYNIHFRFIHLDFKALLQTAESYIRLVMSIIQLCILVKIGSVICWYQRHLERIDVVYIWCNTVIHALTGWFITLIAHLIIQFKSIHQSDQITGYPGIISSHLVTMTV